MAATNCWSVCALVYFAFLPSVNFPLLKATVILWVSLIGAGYHNPIGPLGILQFSDINRRDHGSAFQGTRQKHQGQALHNGPSPDKLGGVFSGFPTTTYALTTLAQSLVFADQPCILCKGKFVLPLSMQVPFGLQQQGKKRQLESESSHGERCLSTYHKLA